MAKILSQDEIDALLSNVSGMETEEHQKEADRKVSLYDFKHPNLVSKEQMRLLETIHEGVCRNFGVFLSAQLRMIVEMNLLAIDQIMYSEFVMSIAPPSAIYVSQVESPHSQFVIEINPQLAVFIVERLFGGHGNFISEARPISIIEQRIMRRVVDRLVHEISKNWGNVTDIDCAVDRFESNPEFVQIAPSSEPVVVASMEIKIHGHSTLINICYPYMWISSIVSKPEVQEKIMFGSKESSPEEKKLLETNLYQTNVQLRAVIGRSHITVKDFIDLKEGDVVPLKENTSSALSVYVRKRHLFNAVAGVRNKRYAFRITSTVEGDDNHE